MPIARAAVAAALAVVAACSQPPPERALPDLPKASAEASFKVEGRAEERVGAVVPESRPAAPASWTRPGRPSAGGR